MSAADVPVGPGTPATRPNLDSENLPFHVECRSALNGDLLAELQQEGPCPVGVLQSQLAAMLYDDARPVLMLQGSPLASTDVLREDASLEVIRRTLPEEAANGLQEARTAVSQVRSDYLQEVKALRMPPEPLRDVLSAVLRLLVAQWYPFSFLWFKVPLMQ